MCWKTLDVWQVNISKCCLGYYALNIKSIFIIHPIIIGITFIIDIELSGGSFYTDGLSDYLQVHGHMLTNINLVHIEEMDKRCFAIITICCPNLVEFGLQNCELLDDQGNQIRLYLSKRVQSCNKTQIIVQYKN